MGYVYKITCIPSGKSYIGISIHEPEKGRIKKHLSGNGNLIIARSVKKYGQNAFTYEVLEQNVFPELLPDLEVFYIKKFNTVSPHGFNLTSGGEENKAMSPETREKLSRSNIGKTPWNKGKKMSQEFCEKMSQVKLGRKIPAKTRHKMSESHKRNGIRGENHHNYGKPLSPEHKQNISKSNTGKTLPKDQLLNILNNRYSKTTVSNMSESMKGKNVNPKKEEAHLYFLSLPEPLDLREKRKLVSDKFSDFVVHSTICRWVREWSGITRPKHKHKKYYEIQEYYFALPKSMSFFEKRKQTKDKFNGVINPHTINLWTKKWEYNI